jgi:hypothetical protein
VAFGGSKNSAATETIATPDIPPILLIRLSLPAISPAGGLGSIEKENNMSSEWLPRMLSNLVNGNLTIEGVVRDDCGTFISYKYEIASIFLPYRVTEVIVEVCTEPLPSTRSAAEHW